MSTKPSSGESVNSTPAPKGPAKDSGKVVAPKATQKPEASRPLGVSSTGSVKITG